MKERLTRRQFLKRAGGAALVLAESAFSSGCDESFEEPKQNPYELVHRAATMLAEGALTPGAGPIETPRIPTPVANPTEAPTPRLEGFRAVEGENLIYLVEQYPVFDEKDIFYPWYRFNGGEKLFEPWSIPGGAFIIIPYPDKIPPPLPEIKTPSEKWEDQLSSRTTSLVGSSANRMNNIRVAAEKLNGTIVLPYRLFSMLEALGPYTKEAGYGPGYGYTDEGEVPMFAGGVCQFPATAFKPAAEAGMLVVERKAHSYYSARYGPWDATINEGGGNLGPRIDFTFRNLFDFPIQIRAEIGKDGKDLTISIFSPNPLPYEEVKTEIIYNYAVSEKAGGKAAVRQKVVFKGRARERVYYSQYSPKP